MTESTIKLLIADDDSDVLETVAFLFREEGYRVTTAVSHAEALHALERATFAFVLTDLFDHSPAGMQLLGVLRDAAYPTPIGVTSAWRITEEEVTRAGFACFIAKPFDINDLLSCVAQSVHQPMTPELERQAGVIREFAARVSSGAWDALMDLCSDDVRFIPAYNPASPPRQVHGKVGYRAYIDEMAHLFPRLHVEDLHIVAMPHDLAARYTARWQLRGEVTMTGGLIFAFDPDDRIRQIGVHLDAERLRILQSAE